MTAKVAVNADDSSQVSSNQSTSAPLRRGRSAGTGKIATAEPLPSQIDLDQENYPTSDAEEPEPAHSESNRHPRTNYESMFDENDDSFQSTRIRSYVRKQSLLMIFLTGGSTRSSLQPAMEAQRFFRKGRGKQNLVSS